MLKQTEIDYKIFKEKWDDCTEHDSLYRKEQLMELFSLFKPSIYNHIFHDTHEVLRYDKFGIDFDTIQQLEKGHEHLNFSLSEGTDYFSKTCRDLKDLIPIIPESTLIGVFLSCLSLPSITKIKIKFPTSEKKFASGIFFLGELPSGSQKTRLVETFMQPYRESVKKYNQSLEKKIRHLEEYNTQVLAPYNNSTVSSIESQLQKKKASFFSIVASETIAANALFLSSKGIGVEGDYSLCMFGWDGSENATTRVAREFDRRTVACAFCLFSQPGLIEKFLKVSKNDGFFFRFLFSNEPCVSNKNIQTINTKDLEKKLYSKIKKYYEFVFSLPLNQSSEISPYSDIDGVWNSLGEVSIDPNCEETNDVINNIKEEVAKKSKKYLERGESSIASYLNKTLVHVLKMATSIHLFNLSESNDTNYQYLTPNSLEMAYEFLKKYNKIFFDLLEHPDFSSFSKQKKVLFDLISKNPRRHWDDVSLSQYASQHKAFRNLQTQDKKAYLFAKEAIYKLLDEGDLIKNEKGKIKINKEGVKC